MKRIVYLIAAVAFTVGTTVSCSSGSDTGTNNTQTGNVTVSGASS